MNTMKYKGFQAQIMKAPRLEGDYAHRLPPGQAINVYPVDAFENPLSNWLKGPGNYVVPVDSEWGLWFNWNLNDRMNTSVLLSIKGMNPITGQRSNGFALERYETKCPVHNEEFKDGLFCEKCNFKWPSQNYVSYPNTLWWDGFRTSEGKVRQFFFTEELAKSIPELVIGKEDTIPAFGFAFFKPKVRRETPITISERSHNIKLQSAGYNSYGYGLLGLQGITGIEGPKGPPSAYTVTSSGNLGLGSNFNVCDSDITASLNFCSSDCEAPIAVAATPVDVNNNKQFYHPNFDESQLLLPKKRAKSKKSEVGVGAGAEIFQDLIVDPLKVSDWEDEPASVMRLYFVFIEQFKEIEAKGMLDLVGEKEGYLSNLPVG